MWIYLAGMLLLSAILLTAGIVIGNAIASRRFYADYLEGYNDGSKEAKDERIKKDKESDWEAT